VIHPQKQFDEINMTDWKRMIPYEEVIEQFVVHLPLHCIEISIHLLFLLDGIIIFAQGASFMGHIKCAKRVNMPIVTN
jgi:hypothetical protein